MTSTSTGPHITRARNVTYMGRAAKVSEVRATSKATGERVAITRWVEDSSEENGSLPAGTVEARHMRGDGRFPQEFSLFAHVRFDGPTAAEDAQAWAVEQITLGRGSTALAMSYAQVHRVATIRARQRAEFLRTPSVPVADWPAHRDAVLAEYADTDRTPADPRED